MSVIRAVYLKRLDKENASLIKVPPGDHVIGRGSILQCEDRRVSREHGRITMVEKSDCIQLTSTHLNPIFYKLKSEADLKILTKDSSIEINERDTFGLLPDIYWFGVVLKDISDENITTTSITNINETTNVETQLHNEAQAHNVNVINTNDVTSADVSSTDIDSPKVVGPRSIAKRKVPSWMGRQTTPQLTNDGICKTSVDIISPSTSNVSNIEQYGLKRRNLMGPKSSDTVTSGEAIQEKEPDVGKPETSSSVTSSCLQQQNKMHSNSTDGHLKISQDGTVKKELPEPDANEKEISAFVTSSCSKDTIDIPPNVENMQVDDNSSDEIINYEEPSETNILDPPSEDNISSSSLPASIVHLPANLSVNSTMVNVATQVHIGPSGTAPSLLTQPRSSCSYGQRCYRRNPAHRMESAHPGDADYVVPAQPNITPNLGAPDCPYGNQCYRQNPDHFRTMTHPKDKDTPGTTLAKRKRTTRQDPTTTYGDLDDSQSDPYNTDSSEEYVPETTPDTSQRDTEDW